MCNPSPGSNGDRDGLSHKLKQVVREKMSNDSNLLWMIS